jgi:Zn-dependent peptidase ImmA (M78 family)
MTGTSGTSSPSLQGVDPERDAGEILRVYWAKEDEVITVPVDPIAIARKLDMAVYTANLADNVSGMLFMKPGHDPEIYLSKTDNYKRQRFTCAHEIGHWTKHIAEGVESDEVVDYRGSLASTGADPVERYANQFAAALLMPADEVRRLQGRGYGPVALADILRVSPEAAAYRVQNLRG